MPRVAASGMQLALPNSMKRPRLVTTGLALLLPLVGCRDNDDQLSGPAPPPAALIAPVRESMSLNERLAVLESELSAAIAGELQDDAVTRVVRAEAVTDRLLEADIPVKWIDEGYFVEARLRQIQASADRLLAQIRRGETRSQVLTDVKSLHEDVVELRAALHRSPGRVAPEPLDSLLETAPPDADSSGGAPSRESRPRPRVPVDEDRLLGVPVPDGDAQ